MVVCLNVRAIFCWSFFYRCCCCFVQRLFYFIYHPRKSQLYTDEVVSFKLSRFLSSLYSFLFYHNGFSVSWDDFYIFFPFFLYYEKLSNFVFFSCAINEGIFKGKNKMGKMGKHNFFVCIMPRFGIHMR